MAAASAAGDPTQALEAWQDHVPGTAEPGRACPGSAAGGRQLAVLVAKQRWRHQTGAHHCLLRSPWRTPSLMTSTSRTARCGPACRVVWQGSASYTGCPYADGTLGTARSCGCKFLRRLITANEPKRNCMTAIGCG